MINRGSAAAYAGAAKATIAPRVSAEVLLMIGLGEVELWRVQDFCRDGVIAHRF